MTRKHRARRKIQTVTREKEGGVGEIHVVTGEASCKVASHELHGKI